MRADIQKAWDESPEFKDIRYPGQGPGPDQIEAALNGTEQVKCIIRCIHSGKRQGGLGYVTLKCTAVATTENIYLLREGTFTKGLSKSTEAIPYKQLTGITVKRQLALGTTLEISRASNVDQLAMCNADQAAKWAAIAKELMNSSSNQSSGATVTAALDPLDQLKKLKDLLDAGVISQEEFDDKKKSLMDKI